MMKRNAPLGWVLYDASCGFCATWMAFWRATLQKRGFEIAPLESAWVARRLDVARPELLRDLRLLLADGSQRQGADVYRYVMRRIWWAWPIYLLSVAPLARGAFDWSYRAFADNRYRFSRACGLERRGR